MYHIFGILSIGDQPNFTTSRIVSLGGDYDRTLFSEFRVPDVVSLEMFMEQANYLTGTVVEITGLQGTIGGINLPLGDAIIALDIDGRPFAVDSLNFMVNNDMNFVIEHINPGDEITAFSTNNLQEMVTEDDDTMRLLRGIQVLVVNGEVHTVSSSTLIID